MHWLKNPSSLAQQGLGGGELKCSLTPQGSFWHDNGRKFPLLLPTEVIVKYVTVQCVCLSGNAILGWDSACFHCSQWKNTAHHILKNRVKYGHIDCALVMLLCFPKKPGDYIARLCFVQPKAGELNLILNDFLSIWLWVAIVLGKDICTFFHNLWTNVHMVSPPKHDSIHTTHNLLLFFFFFNERMYHFEWQVWQKHWPSWHPWHIFNIHCNPAYRNSMAFCADSWISVWH